MLDFRCVAAKVPREFDVASHTCKSVDSGVIEYFREKHIRERDNWGRRYNCLTARR